MRIFMIFAVFLSFLFSHEIINGDILILKIKKDEAKKLILNDKEIKWIPNPKEDSEFVAIIPANYRQKDDMLLKHGDEEMIIKLVAGDYKKENLSVEPSKVKPPKSVAKRIKKEYEEAVAIYNKTEPTYLFDKPFILPLNSKITSNFGNARVYNGELKGYHSGIDYRASIGTQVPSSNDGVVKIAKDRYYAGGSVVIDHGGGIYSQYYHLSKILVKVGDRVSRGDIIALSGNSGRTTGPHLHFGIAINNHSVNPLTFVEKINSLMN